MILKRALIPLVVAGTLLTVASCTQTANVDGTSVKVGASRETPAAKEPPAITEKPDVAPKDKPYGLSPVDLGSFINKLEHNRQLLLHWGWVSSTEGTTLKTVLDGRPRTTHLRVTKIHDGRAVDADTASIEVTVNWLLYPRSTVGCEIIDLRTGKSVHHETKGPGKRTAFCSTSQLK